MAQQKRLDGHVFLWYSAFRVIILEKVENRYMFDTNALNCICKNLDDETSIYQSKSLGWEYFFSEIQGKEAGANITKQYAGVSPDVVERKKAELALSLLRIIQKLQTNYIGLIATLRPFGWALDGTYNILPDNEQDAAKLFADILNENDSQYYNDAMIAMTAIVNGCTVVTNDKRLFNKINHHYPGRAIKYEDFLECVRVLVDSTKKKSPL